MKLLDLDPEFLRIIDERSFHRQDSMDQADGILFLCPKCFTEHGGRVGTHAIICWRPHVPQNIGPMPGRWDWVGTGAHDLSLVAGSSSVLLQGGCCAHFFVRSGEIVMA